MLQAILFGFLYGFVLCFTFGPAFFRLIQTSIDNGVRSGVLIAAGVTAADAILMFFAVFGTSYLPQVDKFDTILAFLGAGLLLVLGFLSLTKKQKQITYPQSKFGSFLFYFINGLFLNLLNPSNYVAVFGTSTYLKGAFHFSINEIIVFFSMSLLGTMIAESGIAFYANKMKKVMTESVITRINQIAGIVFIFSAGIILWKQFRQ
jgi:threonine/homoserine/homoserine lactone efflux protein